MTIESRLPKDMLHNRVMVRVLFILSVFASLFLSAAPVAAQSLGQDPVQFIITPEVPGPGDTVTIEAQGVGNFLGDANITWQIGGKTVLSGIGKRTVSFVAGGPGTQSTVNVTIVSTSKGTITRSFTFRPATVHLLWEADTSVPVWYKSKALYSAGSTIKVMAIPQVVSGGKTISSNNLSFQWKINSNPLTEQSGRGYNTISFAGSQLNPSETVSVDVLNGATTVAQASITIPASKPAILLYEQDPLRGILSDQALINSASLTKTEVTVRAVPYFFDNASLQNGVVPFAWQLNGEDITGPETSQGLLTLRQSGSGAGSASLNVAIQNTDPSKYVQSAAVALRILFGSASSGSFSSFFGL